MTFDVRYRLIVFASLAGFVAGSLLFLIPIFNSLEVRDVDMSGHHVAMVSCTDRVLQKIAATTSFGSYEKIWRLCGNEIFNGLYLDDFLIRRQKFNDQRLDERVNLCLVVMITLSGVVLAGVQLWMSYKLATANRSDLASSGELAIETGKLSLKSSVTGLFIFAISLAFFTLYVFYIYAIKEIPLLRPDNLLDPAPVSSYDKAEMQKPAAKNEFLPPEPKH